jgi:uncharacterized protein (TIGR00106 family)
MFPLDKGESLSHYVAPSLDIVDKSGLKYQFTPMATILEGEWEEVMAVVQQCYERMSKDCNRVVCNMKFDARKNTAGRLTAKTEKVETILKKKLAK